LENTEFTIFLVDDDLALAMPELDGLDVQEALTRQSINRPVIFLTGQATVPKSVQAMKAGALNFLTKPIDSSELLSAIKTCEDRDKTQRHREAQRTLILQRIAKLTPREREVLDYVIRGSLNKQIGFALGVHEKQSRYIALEYSTKWA
jgi:FixJ family two-component response regulator